MQNDRHKNLVPGIALEQLEDAGASPAPMTVFASGSGSDPVFRSSSLIPADPHYFGIAGRPAVIASSHPLDSYTGIDHPPRKGVYPFPDQHNLVPVWDNAVGPAVRELVTHAVPSGPITIDALRLGYDLEGSHPTIWVGVADNALTKKQGRAIVEKCLQVCKAHGVDEIRVEIRQISLSQQAVFMDRDTFSPDVAPRAESFAASLGTTISSETTPEQPGSAGMVWTFPQSATYVMLTAAHVVVPDTDEDRATSHTLSDGLGPSVRVHSTGSLRDVIKGVQEDINDIDQQIADWQAKIAPSKCPPPTPALITSVENRVAALLATKEDLASWKDQLETELFPAGSRTFGNIILRPSIGYSITLDACPEVACTRDYCLIQTDMMPAQFPNFNTIHLVNGQERRLAKKLPNPKWADDHSFDRICASGKTIPIADLIGSSAKSRVVVKRGAKTGLTIGTTSRLKSFVRIGKHWSEEVPVTGLDGGQFSKKGDSGSTVIERDEGHMVGLLTSGPVDVISPVSYLTPMAWIEADLRTYGLQPTIPAAQ